MKITILERSGDFYIEIKANKRASRSRYYFGLDSENYHVILSNDLSPAFGFYDRTEAENVIKVIRSFPQDKIIYEPIQWL